MDRLFTQALADSFEFNSDRLCVVDLGSAGEPNRLELTYEQVRNAAAAVTGELDRQLGKRDALKVGIVARNSANWVIADIACLLGGYIAVPLPMVFSKAQAEHLAATCDGFLVDATGARTLDEKWGIETDPAKVIDLNAAHVPISTTLLRAVKPDTICKVIHTSGTTSRPKGVQITIAALQETLGSLCKAIPAQAHRRYLSMVPLSLLLEQVTAIYLPLLRGGSVHFLPESCPLLGEPGAAPDDLIARLLSVRPTAVTVPPVVIDSIAAMVAGPHKHQSEIMAYWSSGVHFTCGGAIVSPETLFYLASHGIDVFQGYGLSENTSVVSVNTAEHQRIGSVGKPLEHVQVRIAADNSIEVSSTSLFSGYACADPSSCSFTKDGWLDTGDLGRLDQDGFLFVHGRKKNVLCLPNGRNVSPEQVEADLKEFSGVREAVVFLDKANGLVALIIGDPDLSVQRLSQWTHSAFSDIERPAVLWTLAAEDKSTTKFFTVTGRPKRAEIAETYLSCRTTKPFPEVS
ncbi:MAG: AMP-binding protein [Marinobacter sp.]|uniref:AMP-binding protein n=1 Tax=Marinobacter sp. AC-23 TaxID=1879031 RepID=UPI0008DD51D9|nr:AMP-binding protein [Marinobacter sp. AC-23]OHY80023.1 AMP-dependent synthetase [Marinobacter sp. AC-23]